MSPATIVLREEPYLLVHFPLANHDWDGNEDVAKKKDQMSRTIAQNVRFKTVYIS